MESNGWKEPESFKTKLVRAIELGHCIACDCKQDMSLGSHCEAHYEGNVEGACRMARTVKNLTEQTLGPREAAKMISAIDAFIDSQAIISGTDEIYKLDFQTKDIKMLLAEILKNEVLPWYIKGKADLIVAQEISRINKEVGESLRNIILTLIALGKAGQ